MTMRSVLSRRLPPRVKQLFKSSLRPRVSMFRHRWMVARSGLRPGDTVAVVASAAEAARLPSDVHRFVKAARAKGCEVELFVLDFDLAAPPPALPDRALRCFWVDAAPSASEPVSDQRLSIPSDLSEAPYPLPDDGWATGYYDNGKPVLLITRHPGGTRLEHLDASGQAVQRDEFDHNGRLVRRVDLDPATGKPVACRYVDSSGDTWLGMWAVNEEALHPVRRLRPHVKEYDSLADVQTAWLRDRIGRTARARVLAGGKVSRPFVQRAQG